MVSLSGFFARLWGYFVYFLLFLLSFHEFFGVIIYTYFYELFGIIINICLLIFSAGIITPTTLFYKLTHEDGGRDARGSCRSAG